jgi:hypothetical protein
MHKWGELLISAHSRRVKSKNQMTAQGDNTAAITFGGISISSDWFDAARGRK